MRVEPRIEMSLAEIANTFVAETIDPLWAFTKPDAVKIISSLDLSSDLPSEISSAEIVIEPSATNSLAGSDKSVSINTSVASKLKSPVA